MSTLYHIGRLGQEALIVILAEDFRSYLEQMLECRGLPPGSYWVRESTPDVDPRKAVRDWGVIEIHTNGRWTVQTDAGIFSDEKEHRNE